MKRNPPDDIDSWHNLTRTVKPLSQQNAKHVAPPQRPRLPRSFKSKDDFPFVQKILKPLSQKQAPVRIDAALDLHGMKVDVAHRAVIRFLQDCYKRDLRCVEIITGRGDPMRGTGVLRREVPLWVQLPPIKSLISAIEAPINSRGGAYLLMLRRNKTKN